VEGQGLPKLGVPVVVGTRPEAIKLVPVIQALRESDCFEPIVVSTGQHHAMVQEIFELAEIATDVELWIGGAHSQLNERVATVMRRFEDFCREWFGTEGKTGPTREEIRAGRFPPAVLVHGDTSSAFAAALAAFNLRIPVMHIEAGLRTGGLNLTPFPEELNRRLIAEIACFHFAPTATNLRNLARENVDPNQVFITGNTGIDALDWASRLEAPFPDESVAKVVHGDARIVVVTAHRRENWEHGLAGVAEGIGRLARAHPKVEFVIPLHPNPLVHERLGDPLRDLDNVVLTEPMGYAGFAHLLAHSFFVITDSGGIQEEAPSLGKPVLVARESTERTEGVAAGTIRLVGTDPDLIVAEADRLLTDPEAYRVMSEAPNPYGDGRAAERIVAALEQLRYGGEPPHPFGAGYDRLTVLRAAGFERLDPAEIPPTERGAEEPRPVDEVWPG
jgi:UDP-N-acetylglucosamine 2-epimerase (non-hydrolysing)